VIAFENECLSVSDALFYLFIFLSLLPMKTIESVGHTVRIDDAFLTITKVYDLTRN
jgi:hypothetical protein